MLALLLRVAFGAGSLPLMVDGDWAKNRGQSIARLRCRYVVKKI